MAIRSKIWDAMKPDQQAKFQAAADKAIGREHGEVQRAGSGGRSSTSRRKARRSTTPDLDAFRTFAQKNYLDKYGNDWPKGALEKINAIK